MPIRTLVIGAYGNFGRIICRHLNPMPGVQLVIAGRNAASLEQLAEQLPGCERWCGDAMADGFTEALRERRIDWVIHTGGPFQGQPYRVAEACIEAGANYCDLADCRTFVSGITQLQARACSAGVTLLSGCSSVPSLSSAILDEQRHCFSHIDTLEHGITSSAKMPGLSTIEGVLAYAGRPIPQWRDGQPRQVSGWLGLQLRHLPGVGWRLLNNVDVPDMAIFPSRYGARTLAFKAGSGLIAGSLANATLALLLRLGWVRDPLPWARRLHRLGLRFERFGDGKSALYLDVRGRDRQGQPLRLRAQVTALEDKGPEIPSCAAVALIAKVASGYRPQPGARPCVGEISVAEYLAAIDAPDKIDYRLDYQQG